MVISYVIKPRRVTLIYILNFWFCFLHSYNCDFVDEEATELRFFVDEPTYTDLHWVYPTLSFTVVNVDYLCLTYH